ncbi:DUF4822 domain-containing protein [Nocardia sp. XZ_19_385]|uniref:DUF4822 domain-containing protein n=1 Tax=Nocardia sp. XZ_19_385 TaxID=2769488 RepID=UPI001E5530CF|nr:DUF4822 domain-containing protein [Nocardia sp. XZ_19_385]
MTGKRVLTKKITALAVATAAVGLLGACSSDNNDGASSSTVPTSNMTPSSTVSTSAATATEVVPGSAAAALASTPWETTSATGAQGAEVPLTDDNVKNYVGFAYFKSDGTFTMFNLDDTPKMHGDWSVSPDGKTRTIIAKNDAGEEQSRRVVDIVTLNDKEFTYRVYPNPDDKAVYYDIIHTPTTHPEPTK